jgi:hypothetical protein
LGVVDSAHNGKTDGRGGFDAGANLVMRAGVVKWRDRDESE